MDGLKPNSQWRIIKFHDIHYYTPNHVNLRGGMPLTGKFPRAERVGSLDETEIKEEEDEDRDSGRWLFTL